MVRMLIVTAIRLLANAIGLLIAAWLVPGMSIDGPAFIIAVVIFTLVEVIADPLLTKMAIKNVPALRGGVALVTTFVGLVLTTLLTDGLSISGTAAWLEATVIVWLAALIAGLILPVFMVKKAVDNNNA